MLHCSDPGCEDTRRPPTGDRRILNANHRASEAQLLGLSRQGLSQKRCRRGLGDLDS